MIHFKPFRFGQTEWLFIGAILFLIALSIGTYTIPVVADWYSRATEAWTQLALEYGYAGAFLSALIGSVTIVIVFPYTVVVFFLATRGLDPLWLGVLMGLGATIGQMSGYLIGMWGSGALQRRRPAEYEALEKIVAQRPWLVQWLLFIFATTPLPDDILFIPLGMLRYSWWKVVLPTAVGKICSGLLVTYSSQVVTHFFTDTATSPLSTLLNQVGSLVGVVLIVYAILHIDWTRMMHRMLDNRPPRRLP